MSRLSFLTTIFLLIFALTARAGCLDSLLRQKTKPDWRVNATKDFSNELAGHPNILKKLQESEARILTRIFFRSDDVDKILSLVPERLREGFKQALSEMQMPSGVAAYIRRLQEETFVEMLSSRNSSLVALAKEGALDHATMVNVLRSRAADRGANVVTLKAPLAPAEFNKEIGRGYIIDKGFPESFNGTHGVYTHFLQQDMAYDIIALRAGVTHQEIIDFFGTPEGLRVWTSMFDSFSNTPLGPEWFNGKIMNGTIPLGRVFPNFSGESYVDFFDFA